ncbi:MAG: dTDP-4-dehydrorhamnose 3,5-epimerase [Patescibacteria group bacterium]
MKIINTKFSDAFLIEPVYHRDHRGFFVESFSQKWLEQAGVSVHFVQDNHSLSVERGVLRGLHFQLPPVTQAKFIRVIHGSVFDVIIDLRRSSETYRQWESFELSEKNGLMLFIPKGFAHGFCTLEPNTEFMYKVDQYYSTEHEGGILWSDSELNIPWPVEHPVVSERDAKWPQFKDQRLPF